MGMRWIYKNIEWSKVRAVALETVRSNDRYLYEHMWLICFYITNRPIDDYFSTRRELQTDILATDWGLQVKCPDIEGYQNNDFRNKLTRGLTKDMIEGLENKEVKDVLLEMIKK